MYLNPGFARISLPANVTTIYYYIKLAFVSILRYVPNQVSIFNGPMFRNKLEAKRVFGTEPSYLNTA